VYRSPCPENGRITNATLTDAGYAKMVATAPGHVETVRRLVLDVLSEDQLRETGEASRQILTAILGPCAPIGRRPGSASAASS
jgi:DNA-binding MarR family transcriptional regulator